MQLAGPGERRPTSATNSRYGVRLPFEEYTLDCSLLVPVTGSAMSVVTLGDHAPKLTAEIHSTASKAGLRIPESHIDDFASLLGALDQSVQKILDADDYWPIPDLTEYPRTNIKIPQGALETDKGGWATKCIAKSISATTGLLKGRSIALKDNVALAGVRCTNGTAAMEWTPEVDATVATRIMDAGGIITGKAACENACLEGVSDTSVTGKVHNPYADGYSAGGSSSGSGRLVASGAVDLAIGCDQGGSIRIPSSNCGIVGLKPTWGLVPYTGIISLECTIDHVGPMARNAPDISRLLEAIAGPDGVDDRQSTYLPPQTLQYTSQLDGFLSTSLKDPSKSLEGIKVGMLQEAFNMANMDSNIKRVCEAAVSKLRDLGAEVRDVSVPTHRNAAIVWMCYLPIAGGQPGLLSNMSGRKQLYMTDRVIKSGRRLTQESFDALGPSAQNFYLRYLYLDEKYGPELQAKCSNLIRKNNVIQLAVRTLGDQSSLMQSRTNTIERSEK